ncbi:MAG: TolB family protein [Anaerolineales bacterium]
MRRKLALSILIFMAVPACAQTGDLPAAPTPTTPSTAPSPTATLSPSPTATASVEPTATPRGGSGKIAFVSDRDGSNQIYLMNADGSGVRQLTYGPGENAKPAWSPDGLRIAFTSDRDGNREIYIMQSDGSGQLNFTNYFGDDHSPAWSPDGSAIAFVNNFEGAEEVVVLELDGTLRKRIRSGLPYPQRALCCVGWFSEDLVSFTSIDEGVGTIVSASLSTGESFIHRDIDQFGYSECCRMNSPLDDSFLMISLESGVEQIYWMNRPQADRLQLTLHSEGSHGPDWSPDGRWILYYADEKGAFEVFVMRTDEPEPVNLTNNPANDLEPAWRPLP